MQADRTSANNLDLAITGQPLPYLFLHAVLAYPVQEEVEPCQTEALLSFKHWLSGALGELGGVLVELQPARRGRLRPRGHDLSVPSRRIGPRLRVRTQVGEVVVLCTGDEVARHSWVSPLGAVDWRLGLAPAVAQTRGLREIDSCDRQDTGEGTAATGRRAAESVRGGGDPWRVHNDCTVSMEGPPYSLPCALDRRAEDVRPRAGRVAVWSEGRMPCEHPRGAPEQVALDPEHCTGEGTAKEVTPLPIERIGRRNLELARAEVVPRAVDDGVALLAERKAAYLAILDPLESEGLVFTRPPSRRFGFLRVAHTSRGNTTGHTCVCGHSRSCALSGFYPEEVGGASVSPPG